MLFFKIKEKSTLNLQTMHKDYNGMQYSHCLMMVTNLVISNNDSKEKADSIRERIEVIRPFCVYNDDSIVLCDYQKGVKQVYSQGKLMTYKLFSKEPVDMDCVKEAIIQMNDEKKIKTNKLGVAERIISDGLIGGGKEEMTAGEFMEFLKGFMKVTPATYYAGRPDSGKIAEWMVSENKDKYRKRIVSFATEFIRKYSELKEAKL